MATVNKPQVRSVPTLPANILRIQYGQDQHARTRFSKRALFEAVRYARITDVVAYCFRDITAADKSGVQLLVAFDRGEGQSWNSWTALIYPSNPEQELTYTWRYTGRDRVPQSTHLPLGMRHPDMPDWMKPSDWRLFSDKDPIVICERIGTYRSQRRHQYVFYARQPPNLWGEGSKPRQHSLLDAL
jgi:hypothetical protein